VPVSPIKQTCLNETVAKDHAYQRPQLNVPSDRCEADSPSGKLKPSVRDLPGAGTERD